jgi:hypothetical protein
MIELYTNQCAAVVEFHDARARRSSEIIDERAVSSDSKADLVARVEAEHFVSIQELSFDANEVVVFAFA